jgi:hypothetical protein
MFSYRLKKIRCWGVTSIDILYRSLIFNCGTCCSSLVSHGQPQAFYCFCCSKPCSYFFYGSLTWYCSPVLHSHSLISHVGLLLSLDLPTVKFYDPHLSPRREKWITCYCTLYSISHFGLLWSLILTTIIALGYCICHTCSCSMILTLTPLIALWSALSHLMLVPYPKFHTLYWSSILNFIPNIDNWSPSSHLILIPDPQFHTQFLTSIIYHTWDCFNLSLSQLLLPYDPHSCLYHSLLELLFISHSLNC